MLVFSLYSEKLGVLSTLVSALIVCGLLYLLADFARRGGKAKEPALWKKWGGMPSTQVLRHRENTTFDVASLQRYHAILAKKMGARFPNAGEEAADPQAADALYTSAGNMLRNATRDTKQFGLLYKDNISYGFRRNAFGLRCVAISLCLGSLVWVGVRHGLNSWVIRFQAAATPESLLNGGELTSVAVSLAMLFLWLRYFTEQSVREGCFLLRTHSCPDLRSLGAEATSGTRHCRKIRIDPGTPFSRGRKPLAKAEQCHRRVVPTQGAGPAAFPLPVTIREHLSPAPSGKSRPPHRPCGFALARPATPTVGLVGDPD